jgi:hypothetical protein
LHVPIAIDHKFDYYARAILVLEQGSQPRRQGLGNHGEVAHTGIDGRGLLRGVIVNRRAFAHQGIDIGDSDQHSGCPVGQLLGDFDLIEVPRRVIVDRRPQQVSQIAPGADGRALGSMPLELGKLPLDCG